MEREREGERGGERERERRHLSGALELEVGRAAVAAEEEDRQITDSMIASDL